MRALPTGIPLVWACRSSDAVPALLAAECGLWRGGSRLEPARYLGVVVVMVDLIAVQALPAVVGSANALRLVVAHASRASERPLLAIGRMVEDDGHANLRYLAGTANVAFGSTGK